MRRSSVLTIVAISCLLFGAAALRLHSRFNSVLAAPSQTVSAPGAVVTPASGEPQNVGKKNAHIRAVSAIVPASPKPADIMPAQPTAAPGTEIYTAKRGESIPTIARRYLGRTAYLTSSELSESIRGANGKDNGDRTGNILKASENIVIPGILSAPIVEKPIAVAKDFEVRAVYLTGIMAASDHGLRIIRHWREVGGNAVVFDIKDSDGSVNIPFEHPLLGKHTIYLHDVPKFVRFLHSQNMHAIARIAIFRDQRLVTEHPELAVQSKRTGQPWRENGKLVWTDPSNPKVQEYNIALARYVAQLGADEIQFDYVRFPAEGDQKDASFVFQTEHPDSEQDVIPTRAPALAGTTVPSTSPLTTVEENGSDCTAPAAKRRKNTAHGASRGTAAENEQTPQGRKNGCNAASAHAVTPRGPQRSDVITAFLKKAYAEIHPTGALLSLDVFGVMAWQRPVDLSHTGQDIVGMAKYCDVLSPMIYPSHFFGMDNIAHPGDAPEHFIGESMERFELITKGSGVTIRPWLQAFHWRTGTYSPEYIKIQVATAREKGGIGFLFWNAANDYSKPFIAMPEMRAADLKEGSKEKPKFFRGDELPETRVKASLTPASISAAAAENGNH
ncbi:MAG: putative glycoside hydrolase [Candidatus Sulfotelmatobacter sp.]